jgi:hypothetical protein
MDNYQFCRQRFWMAVLLPWKFCRIRSPPRAFETPSLEYARRRTKAKFHIHFSFGNEPTGRVREKYRWTTVTFAANDFARVVLSDSLAAEPHFLECARRRTKGKFYTHFANSILILRARSHLAHSMFDEAQCSNFIEKKPCRGMDFAKYLSYSHGWHPVAPRRGGDLPSAIIDQLHNSDLVSHPCHICD